MCVCVCVCVCVNVFLIGEITSKTKMIVVTEAWMRCEIDLKILYKHFCFFSLIRVGVRLGLHHLKARPNKKVGL